MTTQDSRQEPCSICGALEHRSGPTIRCAAACDESMKGRVVATLEQWKRNWKRCPVCDEREPHVH